MPRKEPINSVFPPIGNEVEEYEPFVLNAPASYNGKVMIHDWQVYTQAEPRDYSDFLPPNGNLHRSSYKNFGTGNDGTGISETHAMLAQIEMKDQYITVYPRRSTLNMFSYNLTDNDDREESLRLARVRLLPYNYGHTNYRTTTKSDYQLHYQMRPRPPPPPDPHWLMYRHTTPYDLLSLSRRDGMNKFIDDNMTTHDRIAEMKMKLHRSYDPVLKRYTDTCKLGEYKTKR